MSAPTFSIKDASLKKSLKGGLADGKLTHAEAVDLIRSVLDHGQVTRQEMNDLQLIVDKSKTLTLRSRNLLAGFIKAINDSIGNKKAAKFPEEAGSLVCDFLLRSGGGQFPKFHRDQIGLELLMRLARPGIIDQGSSSLCGAASVLYAYATDQPSKYAQLGIDLFEKGKGQLGNLTIEPDDDCKSFDPKMVVENGETKREIAQVDWMMLASIRDSENVFLDYQSTGNELAGITLPSKLVAWFEAAGYTDIQESTNWVITKGSDTIKEVNKWQAQGYRVCLFIGANMLKKKKQTTGTSTADHWVVLRSPINIVNDKVSFSVFSWGQGEYSVPAGEPLTQQQFLSNFYGYVAAKPN